MFAAMLEDQIARRRHGELPIVELDPAWALAIDGIDPLLERFHESLFTLADGRLGTRGSVIAGQPSGDPGVLMSDVYTRTGPEAHLLAAPRWNTIALDSSSPPAVRRVLDLHAGVLHQQLRPETGRIDALLLSSLARPATVALRVRDRGAGMHVDRSLVAPLGPNVRGRTSRRGRLDARQRAARDRSSRRRTTSCTARRQIECSTGSQPMKASHGAQLTRAWRSIAFEPRGSSGLTVCSPSIGAHWASRWEDADIVIEGDLEMQLAVRFAIFHLLASAPDGGEAAVGARGLSGKGYRGHVFWDSDVYVLPFLAATHPQAARAMLEYRVRRLPAAIRSREEPSDATAPGSHGSPRARVRDVTPQQARDRMASSYRSSPASSRSTSSLTSLGPPPATSTGPAIRRSRPGPGAS